MNEIASKMNKYKSLKTALLGVAACAMLFAGCVKQSGGGKNNDDEGGSKFDYSTTTDIALEVDYSIKGNKAAFQVYAENPMVEIDGQFAKKEEASAILKAYTDNDCKYSGLVTLPTGAEKVWLYSEAYGLPTCVEVEVGDNGVSFDLKEYRETLKKSQAGDASRANPVASRAVEKDNPYNIGSIGKWRHDGYPDYLFGKMHTFPFEFFEPVYAEIPTNLLNRIQTTLLPNADNSAYAKPTEEVNLRVTQDATMNLVYLAEMAAYKNAIGYYFYPTNNPPQSRDEMDELPKYVAFPNCSDLYASDHVGVLESGMQIRLKYFDENGNESDVFPKGTTIGWFLIPDAYAEGYLNKLGQAHSILYSNNEFNSGEARQMVSIYDPESGKIVLGFEDDNTSSKDGDYKDVLFYIDTQKGTVTVPEEETKPEEFPDIEGDPLQGTLAFEDLWPSLGDYDMNDVVVGYSTTFTTDKDNNIVTITDVWTPLNSGGSLKSGFGYLIDVPVSEIKNVTLTSGGQTAQGKFERNQNGAMMTVFNDIYDAAAVNKLPVTVTVELDGTRPINQTTRKKLYNPFICVNSSGFVPDKVRKEIHLTNYPPSQLADPAYFGTADDRSSVSNGVPTGPYYYIAQELQPFAIDLPITDYRVPDESVNIMEFYPDFMGWVNSKGEKNKNWYLKPAK